MIFLHILPRNQIRRGRKEQKIWRGQNPSSIRSQLKARAKQNILQQAKKWPCFLDPLSNSLCSQTTSSEATATVYSTIIVNVIISALGIGSVVAKHTTEGLLRLARNPF